MRRCFAMIVCVWMLRADCSGYGVVSHCFIPAGASNLVLKAEGLDCDAEYLLQQSDNLSSSNWKYRSAPITGVEEHDWLVPAVAPEGFFRLGPNAPPPKIEPWAAVEEINEDWFYLELDAEDLPSETNDAGYAAVSLPHTWNATDTLQTNFYRRGSSWYRRNLVITPEQLNQRLYLRFGAAAQRARVYLNGEELVYHNGGYSAFVCELSGGLSLGTNRIDVWVNNEKVQDIAPQSGDFNFYGGLYRSVQLITAPTVSVARAHRGGPGFRIWSEAVDEQSADVNLDVWIDNGETGAVEVVVGARLLDPNGAEVSSGSNTMAVASSAVDRISLALPAVAYPELWSPEQPNLYRVALTVWRDGRQIDSAEGYYGFRRFELTADAGFFLNGRPYRPRGANRHQDYYEKGNAVDRERHYRDLMLMKEAGCNMIRLAHYQQDDYVLQLCDRLGFLVWEEVPFVNGGNIEALEPTLRSMMTEMIEQHFNHCSVIIWGMGNEVWMDNASTGEACYGLLNRLQHLVHEEDPTRKAGYVSADRDYTSEHGVAGLVDVIGYNLYRGWYGGTHYSTLTARISELHAMDPDTPMMLTEFGAGSDLTIHTDSPRQQDFSIEYQNDFMESHLLQIEELDWLCGATWWAFCDFGSSTREDSIPHVNQKGAVTFDRQKKDAFYLMKSYWSDEPVVRIESSDWTERDGEADKSFRVFSNMDEVEMFLNGVSLGARSNGLIWDVTMAAGTNILRAVGRSGIIEREHTFQVRFGDAVPVGGITVTGQEPANPGAYLIDGNLFTRWAAEGDQVIDYDLYELRHLSGIQIKFYKGETRSYSLVIRGSIDGSEWSELYSGSSSLGEGIIDIPFPASQDIRYLRIEAMGNDENNWNSYYEIIPMETP